MKLGTCSRLGFPQKARGPPRCWVHGRVAPAAIATCVSEPYILLRTEAVLMPAGRRAGSWGPPVLAVLWFLAGTLAALENLTVALYRVYGTRVEIDWYTPKAAFTALTTCELIYGPVEQPERVKVLPNVIPDRHMLELVDLSFNVTYHFHMICNSKLQVQYVSNTLVFTTGSKSKPDSMMLSPSSSHRGSLNVMGGLRPFPVSLETERRIPSSNVILGASCGIVGFLIINITVVMVVRKYSYWRMRRRRMVALQEYNGYPDI